MDRNELVAYSFPGHAGTPLPGHQYGVEERTEQLRAVALREGLTKFHAMSLSGFCENPDIRIRAWHGAQG